MSRSRILTADSAEPSRHLPLREYAPQTPLWVIWDPLIGDCPKREAQNLTERCSVYCPNLVRLFFRPEAG